MSKGEAPLFEAQGNSEEPLAARMRPRNLDEFIGQEEIVGPGRLLRRAIQKDQLSSLIFSGPPGTGKTTLARVIANTTSSRFVTLNAVLAGIAEIRASVEEAKRDRDLYGRRTILFVDEVHRWNKAQQDALLPWVENGTIVLIGATTENPFFEVNRALVSRSRVFQLKALEEADLRRVAEAACADRERGYGRYEVRFGEGALEHLVKTSDGDARSLLNALELAVETSAGSWPPAEGTRIEVSLEAAEESIQRRAVLYDKDGDYHYDAASAFIKSIRGSDPDAALYWLARMIYSGEDPRFAFRRMLISASEDIGLADPNALNVVSSAAAAFDRVGMPEGQFHLAEAALYLATAPKSNSTMGFFDALKAVEAESAEVPDPLKDSSRDKHGFGHGEGYLYPHAYRDHWVAQEYLPSSLRGRIFYSPGSLGAEGERRALVLERREAQLAALAQTLGETSNFGGTSKGSGDSGAVWSERGDARASWSYRAEAEAPERLALLRKALFDAASPARNDRLLVLDARGGYLIWEALRRAREGTVVALARDGRERELIENYASTLDELERPIVLEGSPELLDRAALEAGAGFSRFDLVLGRDLLKSSAEPAALLARLAALFPGARFATMESLPREGGRLSALPLEAALGRELASRFGAFEEAFYGEGGPSELGPGAEALGALAAASPLKEARCERIVETYRRRLGRGEIATWFAPASAYGSRAAAAFKPEELERIRAAVLGAAASCLDWPLAGLIIQGRL
jgi:putative ATPase